MKRLIAILFAAIICIGTASAVYAANQCPNNNNCPRKECPRQANCNQKCPNYKDCPNRCDKCTGECPRKDCPYYNNPENCPNKQNCPNKCPKQKNLKNCPRR